MFTALFDGHRVEIDDIGDVVTEFQRLNVWPGLVTFTCNTCKAEHQSGPDIAPAPFRVGNDIAWEKAHLRHA